jgi:DNA polymerase-3 subunit epsilon
LLDSELLADVWLRMTGTGGLAHGFGPAPAAEPAPAPTAVPEEPRRARIHDAAAAASMMRLEPSREEIERHAAFVEGQVQKALWTLRAPPTPSAPVPNAP